MNRNSLRTGVQPDNRSELFTRPLCKLLYEIRFNNVKLKNTRSGPAHNFAIERMQHGKVDDAWIW